MKDNVLLSKIKYGLVNESGIVSICKIIEDITAEINGELNEVNRLIDLLPMAYSGENTKKFCELFEEEQLVKLNNYCERCTNVKVVLEKMLQAYHSTDEKYSKGILSN